MKRILAGSIPAILILAFVVVPSFVLVGGDVCPDGGGWTKVEGNNPYEVENATEYCYKAGPFIVGSIPDGGFGQDGACTKEDIQNCGLSHWAYFIPLDQIEEPWTATPDPTATDVPPTATDVPPTATDVPPTATDIPPTATPDPTATEVLPTATLDPTATEVLPTETPEPTPEDTPTNTPTSTDVPPTQTPQKPPETGGTDGAFFDDSVYVGGLLFIAVLAIAVGAVKLWDQKQKHVL